MKRPKHRCPSDVRWPDTDQLVPQYFADVDIEIPVESSHEKGSIRRDADHCVLVTASLDLFDHAQIGRGYSRFYTSDTKGRFAIKARTKSMAMRYLTAWDQGGKFPSGTYQFGRISPADRRPRQPGKKGGSGGGRAATINVVPRPRLR